MMNMIIFVIVMLFILMLIRTSIPSLHPLMSIVFFFLLLSKLIFQYFIPFIENYIAVLKIPSEYQIRLLLTSALLFFLSDSIFKLLKENGYDSIGTLVHTSIKIVILGLWMNEIVEIIGTLSKLLSHYS